MAKNPLISASDAAKHDHAVVFCCDSGYLPYAACAAAGLAALTPLRRFDIVICSDEDLSLPPMLQQAGIRLCRIDPGDSTGRAGLKQVKSRAVYLRLSLPKAFAGTYRRILYLDCDICIEGGPFDDLLRTDMNGKGVAAVRDRYQWRDQARHPRDFKTLGWPSGPIFNSGVLLIDVQGWIERDISDRALAFGAEHGENLTHHDQSLLNATLRGDWAELSPMWNWQYHRSNRLIEPLYGPHIIHFITHRKPWTPHAADVSPRFRRRFAEFLRDHFPEAVGAELPIARPDMPMARLARMHLDHVYETWLLRRYLSRFADDLTVLAPEVAP